MFSQVARGATLVKNITASNTPQRVSDVRLLTKSFTAIPAPGNNGSVKMSYGGTSNQPSITQVGVPGQWFDLNQLFVQSDMIGDNVNINYATSFP